MKQAITALSLTAVATASSRTKPVDNSFSPVYQSGSVSFDGISVLYRGGESVIAAVDSANEKVPIYYQTVGEDTGVYAHAIYKMDDYQLEPVDPTTFDATFPVAVALSPASEDLNNLFVSSSTADNLGRIAVYEGRYTTWSLQQFLSPTEEYLDVATFFGKQIAFDSNNYDTLYVACANCSSVNSKRHGSIYTYKQGGNKAWSQAQQIYFPNVFNLGFEGLKVNGDLLLADISDKARDDPSATVWESSTVVLRKDASNKFRPEQLLSVAGTDINAFDVEDHTIVLATKEKSYKTTSNAGAVHILAPTTLPPPAPGKPRPVQWSVQQVLYAFDPTTADNYFGIAVDLDGDRLSVQSEGDSSNYIYERASNGKWSLQQTLSLNDEGASSISLSKGTLYSLTASSIDLFDEFQNDECLLISLEDQFGDGWDVAKLVVTRPDGTKDYISNHCDTQNPHQVRYCPRDSSDAGLYRLALVDTTKATNNWEIMWRVLNEKTGDWVYGDISTKLDYEWDATYGYFIDRKVEKALPNSTCVDCPMRPTDKPTPLLRRLKGDDKVHGTQHPTHTPAPTLETSGGAFNWRTLTLVGDTTASWYENEYRAAYYYVTDTKNRRLITKGTFCDTGAATRDCWLDLPDGEYNIRVGGALLRGEPDDLLWRYCKSIQDFTGQQQLTVKIGDSTCYPIALHNNNALCGRTDAVLVVALDFMVMGASTSGTLSLHDNQILSEAIAYALQGVSAEDVSISSAVPSGSGSYLVSANVGFRRSTTGYDTLTVDGINSILSSVETYMAGEGPRNIWAGLQAAQHSNIFHSTTSVQFVSAKLVGSKDIITSPAVDEVVTFSDPASVSSSASTDSQGSSSTMLESISYGGYAVAGVVAALVVGFFAFGRKRVQSALPVSQEDHVMDSSKRVQLKDLNLVAPSVSDLKQLVKDEDEVLKIMLNRP